MATTGAQMRAWRGPALFTYGFRPFFLGAALWAMAGMGLWLAMLDGRLLLPSRFDPLSWHAHEFLFGYAGAVIAGFLLTAVPNWTGRLPITGWKLAALAAVWLAGRVAVACSALLPAGLVVLADLGLPLVLALAIGREILAGRNWRNLPVLVLIALFGGANTLFHWQAAQGEVAARGSGLRLGLAVVVVLIGLIGGRIVPSFTRNWLMRQAPGRLPPAPMQRFDLVAMATLVLAAGLWVAAPQALPTRVALALAGVAHAARLARWAGHRTLAEPLVLVLHLGYAFVPLGALALALDQAVPGLPAGAAGQHLWMVGAIGLMTLAVMTRATLGHTGGDLHAGGLTVACYAMLVMAVAARWLAGLQPVVARGWLGLSGLAWLLAFGLFVAGYGPRLMRRRG